MCKKPKLEARIFQFYVVEKRNFSIINQLFAAAQVFEKRHCSRFPLTIFATTKNSLCSVVKPWILETVVEDQMRNLRNMSLFQAAAKGNLEVVKEILRGAATSQSDILEKKNVALLGL